MNTLNTTYWLALACFALQFILLGYGSFDQPDIEINGAYDVFLGIVLTAIKGIPWLVLIPGLIMKSKNIMAWMSYVCLVYFIIWIMSAFGDQGSTLGTLGVILTLVQFGASAFHTRMAKRQPEN